MKESLKEEIKRNKGNIRYKLGSGLVFRVKLA